MESLSAFLRRHEPDDDKRLAVLKKLAPRIWLVMAFDTTSDGLLTSNDASGEWFDADSATPPENPLRLHVIRQSDGNASDSPYSLLVQVIAHCRKVANGLCKPDWDGTLHHAYISNEDFALEWEQCLAGATESKPVLAADESSWHTKAREIADELYDHDTKNNCRDSLDGYSKRVMVKMQEKQIKGPRGLIINPNTVKRDALQAERWWRQKQK